MFWLSIIFIIIIGVLSTYIILYKRQIKEIVRNVQFIQDNDTNKNIHLQVQVKEIVELASQLNHLINDYRNEKISISRKQSDFKEELSNISHDLRTPLTSIAGYIQMIESKNTPEEKKVEYYHIIKMRIDTLIKMLDEFFEFTRTEADDYPMLIEKVNVNHMLTDIITLYYYDFVSKGEEPIIELPSKPIYILVDKESLKRIFQNLINNYLKHGSGGLSLSLIDSGSNICIRFKNFASDIESSEVTKLFNRFYTTDKSRTTKTTGLGLAIVQNLVIKMDGKVNAYMEDSYFIIDLLFKKE